MTTLCQSLQYSSEDLVAGEGRLGVEHGADVVVTAAVRDGFSSRRGTRKGVMVKDVKVVCGGCRQFQRVSSVECVLSGGERNS